MKRQYILFILLIASLGIGGYSWYTVVYSKCHVPLSYDIGTIDPRFSLSRAEARTALSDAESLWEDGTGKNLFTFAESGADVHVNFIYDARQETTNNERVLREVIDQKAEVGQSVRADYEKLLDAHAQLKATYVTKVKVYEAKLATYNAEVAKWNTKGGAPSDVYAQLSLTQGELAKENAELEKLAVGLNTIAQKINDMGEKGNSIIRDYNDDVTAYNQSFNEDREFTQGEYQDDHITIFQYDSSIELRLVLAHELGHALSLEHVDDPQSVMYYLMEGQLAKLELSTADIAEYKAVCGAN